MSRGAPRRPLPEVWKRFRALVELRTKRPLLRFEESRFERDRLRILTEDPEGWKLIGVKLMEEPQADLFPRVGSRMKVFAHRLTTTPTAPLSWALSAVQRHAADESLRALVRREVAAIAGEIPPIDRKRPLHWPLVRGPRWHEFAMKYPAP